MDSDKSQTGASFAHLTARALDCVHSLKYCIETVPCSDHGEATVASFSTGGRRSGGGHSRDLHLRLHRSRHGRSRGHHRRHRRKHRGRSRVHHHGSRPHSAGGGDSRRTHHHHLHGCSDCRTGGGRKGARLRNVSEDQMGRMIHHKKLTFVSLRRAVVASRGRRPRTATSRLSTRDQKE